MKKLAVLTLLTFLAALTSRADLIFLETYPYADGNITNVSTVVVGGNTYTNWIVHSSTGVGAFVKNHRQEVSSTSGGNGLAPARADDVHHNFSITNSSIYTNAHQVLYASMIVNFTNLPSAGGAYFAHFQAGSGTFEGRLWAQTNGTIVPGTYRLGMSMGSTPTSANKLFLADLALNTDYQVVIGYNPTTGNPNLIDDSATLWINPVSSTDASVTTGDGFTPTAANIASSFSFRQASGFGGFLTVSNLAVATTFLEAVTNTSSTNPVAATFAIQPPAVSSNFVNAAFSLATIANGQSLGNLAYQWQVASSTNVQGQLVSPVNVTDAGDITGSNTNILAFSSGIVGDTGYYALVVTTPYGLSTTSSVSKVVVSAAPVPPTFVVQPGSQTLFHGQNMILSTTVSSPGNLNYTWYSNNVVISSTSANNGQQVDNGSTSTLELNNVTTNNTATYKVAVTNDVVVPGIVSSNAVVTVTNAPHVSIAYLRSLIDPVTLTTSQPVTQPYEVTGIVTSYTNTTTSDTASYYLQDATAGINIFATFGSTFRPQLGDSVTFVGVLSTFNANTGGVELFSNPQLYPYTAYRNINSSSNPLPAAKTIAFTVTNDFGYYYVNTNLMQSRVTLTNVFFGARAGTTISTSANDTVVVTNQNGVTFQVQFYSLDLDTAGQTLPVVAQSVTGNLIGFHPNVYLAVTKFSDIVVPPPVPIPLGVVFAGGNITFNWADASFTLQTSTNILGSWSDVTGATSGFSTNITTAPETYFRLVHP